MQNPTRDQFQLEQAVRQAFRERTARLLRQEEQHRNSRQLLYGPVPPAASSRDDKPTT
ncbi:MAG: hypothetical protein AB7T15_00840 [Desulfuromonas sp.]|jgi:hypothetical protein|nr:hypothetical protein [Desulfuromonas thiophila]MDD3800928.1 hypothetical protein [Desulfuromonas thiophila]MDY0397030.1 hypothetical protein [Desulfuromonas thiophila]